MSYHEIPWHIIDKRRRITDLIESITLDAILGQLEKADAEKIIVKANNFPYRYEHPDDPDDIPF